jgi:predicted anti-sigma-YlaC factor YlaD
MTEPRPQPIPCEEAVRQLWDYLDDAAPDHAGVEEHLAWCRRCCGELEFVGQLRQMLAAQATDHIQPPVMRRLERFVEEL